LILLINYAMKPYNKLALSLDAVLPQTQCGLCTYKGCMPYAEAIAAQAAPINLCPPGGVSGLKALAQILNADPSPFMAEMALKTKPKLLAVIREAECIGCTKCIQACPVDAILGGAKQMHTVLVYDCTGCELCVAPCPVDCIDLVPSPLLSESEEQSQRQHFRRLHIKHLARQAKQAEDNSDIQTTPQRVEDKKSFIRAALERAKNKPKPGTPLTD
jgi:electron transport complex protein RnfB